MYKRLGTRQRQALEAVGAPGDTQSAQTCTTTSWHWHASSPDPRCLPQWLPSLPAYTAPSVPSPFLALPFTQPNLGPSVPSTPRQQVCHPSLPSKYPSHLPSPAWKRGQPTSASSSDAGDLFGESLDTSDSLFSEDLSPTNPPLPPPNSPLSAAIPPHNPSLPSPRQYDRNARFDQLYNFARACLVTKSETKRQVRSSIWNHLFQLASTPEHLDRVAELFPAWRDAQRSFRPSTVVAFAGQSPVHYTTLYLPPSRLPLQQLSHTLRSSSTYPHLTNSVLPPL